MDTEMVDTHCRVIICRFGYEHVTRNWQIRQIPINTKKRYFNNISTYQIYKKSPYNVCPPFLCPLFGNKWLSMITYGKKKAPKFTEGFIRDNWYCCQVGVERFELPTSCSQSTRLGFTNLDIALFSNMLNNSIKNNK